MSNTTFCFVLSLVDVPALTATVVAMIAFLSIIAILIAMYDAIFRDK